MEKLKNELRKYIENASFKVIIILFIIYIAACQYTIKTNFSKKSKDAPIEQQTVMTD